MGELILCKRPIAPVPLFIEEVSLNVYSLEELSYYIVHNVYLLNSDFMSVELCNWIGRELGMKELENQLLEFLKENSPLHIFVGHILTTCGYLTAKEIRETLELITTFENKSDYECRKMRADRLMDKGKISDAIYEYENIIELCEKTESQEFQGNVWHNLATAYARLFFFEEAATCFENAYLRNRRIQSRNAMLYALRCGRMEEEFNKAVEKYQVPKEQQESIREEVTRQSQGDNIVHFSQQLDEMRIQYQSQDGYKKQLNDQIEEWKTEYINLCRI